MQTLLLIEDDPTIREPLGEHLQKRGFQVVACGKLADAKKWIERGVDLIVLDWELPDGHGIDLLRDLRAQGSTVPVIFLTARTDLMDKIIGLEIGADDYMTKPFEIEELTARIRTRLRSKKQTAPVTELSGAGIFMDLNQRTVRFRNQDVQLTKMEFDLLKFFLENPNRVLARDEILNKVWGFENFPSSRTVDTHVGLLRQKLIPEIFETQHGIGYRFRVDP